MRWRRRDAGYTGMSLSHDETRARLAEAEASMMALDAQAAAQAQELKDAKAKIDALTVAIEAIEAKP